MALHYDKHLETKNKWENQKISKHFKNQLKGDRKWRRDEQNKPYAIDEFDMIDYETSIYCNSIPVWNCSICTYTNIQRKSHCTMCNTSYSYSNQHTMPQTVSSNHHRNTSHNLTLGQFCNNIWDILSIPVWICSKCTYCNVQQLPKCQICLNPYSNQTKSAAENIENIPENYQEFVDEIDEFYNENKQNIISTKPNSQKHAKLENNNTNKVKISVTMKLITNELYQNESVQRNLFNEEVVIHTLLEAELEILEPTNNKLIKSYSYIPAMKNRDDSFTAYDDTVIIPIKYKYRNRFGEFGGFCNNNPLKCIGEFIWKSQYPYLQNIECPEWQFVYPENKNLRCPAEKQYIFDCLLLFLPSTDIITCILFKYLGYDEMEIVKINTVYTSTKHGIGYFKRYKMKDFEKELFLVKHNGKIPFLIHTNPYSTIKSRKINYFLKLTEIGFDHSGNHLNNYWLSQKKNVKHYWGAVCSKYIDIIRERYCNKNVRNRWERRRKKVGKKKRRIDIARFYPKKYLYFKRKGCGAKASGRQRRRKRRIAKRNNKYGGLYFYEWRKKQRENNPRYSNKIVKWYLDKDKRYTDRKWSAYWKLNQHNL